MTRINLLAMQVLSLLAIIGCATESGGAPSSSSTIMPSLEPASIASPTETIGVVASATPIIPSATIDRSSDVIISYDRRTPFVPLDNPQLLQGYEASYLDDDDLVLGLEWNGVTHAYPVRMLRFHHIVNDTIAGRPFLITY